MDDQYLKNLVRYLERAQQRINNIDPDYVRETYGWGVVSRKGKILPYNGWASFRSYQEAGIALFRDCPVVQSAVSKMVSYVVSSGHTYAVSMRDVPGTLLPGRMRVSDKTINEVQAIVEITQDTCYPGGWQSMQEESMLRQYREGEYFRRLFNTATGLVVRFVEPEFIRPPKLDPIGNRDLGIITDDNDAVTVIGYWLYKPSKPGSLDPEKDFLRVPATDIQHGKQGVDANDPRGVPILLQMACASKRIKEVDEAMCELAITQAAYAVIRQYDNTITAEDIRRISRDFQKERDERSGRPNPGSEVDAKGFTFEFPSMSIAASEFVSIIAHQQRLIGGLLDMPEFMVSADARTGNRASLVSAEGPFDRRVQREQKKLANHDIELLWRAVQVVKGWSDEQLRRHRMVIKIEPRFPLAASRDFNKDAQTMIELVSAGLKSPQDAIASLGNDYDIVWAQIEKHAQRLSEADDEVPLPGKPMKMEEEPPAEKAESSSSKSSKKPPANKE